MKAKQIFTICIISVSLFFATTNVLLNNNSNKIADIALSTLMAHADGDGDGNDNKEGSGGDLNWKKYYCPPGSNHHQYSVCEETAGSDPCNQLNDKTGSCK